MARKPKKNAATKASDLEILFPDLEVTVAGKTFIMRELRFAEQLKYNHLIKPLAEAIDQAGLLNIDIENIPEAVLDILSGHAEYLIPLVSVSSGQSVEWINSLPSQAGEELILYWWSVNQAFFFRRWDRKEKVKAEVERLTKIMTGETFSKP